MASSSPSVPETKMNGASGNLRQAVNSRKIFSAENPSNDGIEQSERIRSNLSVLRALRNSAFVSTRTASNQRRYPPPPEPPAAIRRQPDCLQPEGCAAWTSSRFAAPQRRFIDDRPEHAQLLNGFHE